MQLYKPNQWSPPFWHYFMLLFLSSGSFDALAGNTWGRDINGSRMLLLFFFVFPLQHVFLFASDLFQSFSLQDTNGGSHPALGCSSISGGRQGLDLLRTLWAGFLLPAQHESTIQPCRKSCTVNTSFCLLLWSLISRPNSLTIMQMFVDAQKKLPQLFNILKCWTHTVE